MNKLRRMMLKLPLLAAAGRLHASDSGRRPWHLPDGTFANNYIRKNIGGVDELARIARAFAGNMPELERFPIAAATPNQFETAGGRPRITWIGHATFLIQIGGLNILTDPVFTDSVLPISLFGGRGTPPGRTLEQLPQIDAVVISHNHYDHLDAGTIDLLRARSRSTRYLVPLRLAEWFDSDDDVIEHDWWEGGEFAGARFVAVPCQHWSFRLGAQANTSLWCSWVIEAAGWRLLFVGDSGYTPDYRDIGSRFAGFDLAILPIGSYRPRWLARKNHQDPAEAAQARRDLGAARAVASHWGTFRFSLEPMDEPPRKLAAALSAAGEYEDLFWVLQHGQTRELTRVPEAGKSATAPL